LESWWSPPCSPDRSSPTGRGDHGHLAFGQIGRKRRQPIILVFRKTILDRHVAAFDVAGFTQATTQRLRKVRSIISAPTAQEPNNRHCRLLRARRERPCGRAAKQRDEFAS
jgi:hypothetical protein